MSGISHETAVGMTIERSRHVEEVTDMNREFLRLLTHPGLLDGVGVLGLEAAVCGALRRLSAAEIDLLAQAPVLLAEFRPLPLGAAFGQPELSRVADRSFPAAWEAMLHGYSNRLLACLWQQARTSSALTRFCLGMTRTSARQLAALSFCELSRSAEKASAALRARLGDHPTCWPDLIRSARCGEPQRLNLTRMSLIPMTAVPADLSSGRRECLSAR